ncbi:NAD(P)-binding protein [Jackrogersella minutella]|nr:NAD(P)-binding protein [Jackrogersella minutella]
MASKLALNGGVALVTGAANSVEKETAFAFAEAGVEESRKYAKHAQYRFVAIKVNVADEANEFGRIDYSVNSAGIGDISDAITPNLQLDVFSKTTETNIKGTMLRVRAVIAAMAEQEPMNYSSRHGTRSLGRGSIVNLGSVNSYVTVPGMLPYTVSKHAVIGITKSAAIDAFKSQIRVNAVCPSWVDTPMNHASLERVPQLAQIIKAVSPLQRVATTEEVVDYIVFLCSPSSSYINGTGLIIDVGATLTAHVS